MPIALSKAWTVRSGGGEAPWRPSKDSSSSFTYLGIFAVLLLGSLGVPIPEEMPIIAAAILSHEGLARWWLALPVCLVGVLSGDLVLYWVGRHWGEDVLNWRVVRLGPDAEAGAVADRRRIDGMP